MAERIAWLKYNSQKGNGAGIRLYNPVDISYPALRMHTQAGTAAFNLVDPGEGDTGLRILTPRGVKDIKSYLYAQYEDQNRSATFPYYTLQSYTEEIYTGNSYWWYATPRVFSQPLTRTHYLVGNIEATGPNYTGVNDPWCIWLYTTYWWNISTHFGQFFYPGQFYNSTWNRYIQTLNFSLGGEYTIYKMVAAPYYPISGLSYYAVWDIPQYNYLQSTLVYH